MSKGHALTRRAILAGVAATPIAAGAAPATEMGPNDRRLIELERQWRALLAAGGAEQDGERSDLLYDQAVDLQGVLMRTPSETVEGLRVKLRVCRHEVFDSIAYRDAPPDPYGATPPHDYLELAVASLICDVERVIGGAS